MKSDYLKQEDIEKLSPMMRQYVETKEKYPGHVLFFRVGDFYEMFFDDAVRVSRAIELTLTGKECGLAERAPMCGVPHHSAEVYIKKLIGLGFKVAICEQLTPPSAKGLVVRDIVRVVTPGTIIESSMLDDSSNNYLCCIAYFNKCASLVYADISTGEVNLCCIDKSNIEQDIINRLACCRPAEVLMSQDCLKLKNVTAYIKNSLFSTVSLLDDDDFDVPKNQHTIFAQLSCSSFEEIEISSESVDAMALCAVFGYIAQTQKSLVSRFTHLNICTDNDTMIMDRNARRNLELTETMRSNDRRGSLIWVLDRTKTSMGRRFLKKCIEQPLVKPYQIIERQDAVEALINNGYVLFELQDLLSKVYDLERLMTRVVCKTATPRDLKSLSVTAQQLPDIKRSLGLISQSKLISNINDNIDSLEDLATLITNALVDEPPISCKDGGVIREGFNDELDKLHNLITNTSDMMAKLESDERERTGIKALKIGFNRVFGYYFEVTRSYYDLIPDNYIRKQTLANAERFITEELKQFEATVLGAKDKSIALEESIFAELRDFAATKLEQTRDTANALALLDTLCSFAQVSSENNYTRPNITADGIIYIHDGRHPVVEHMLNDEVFVPNDVYLDLRDNRLIILTGPNMSGKSTYMRQVALIVLMAQTGCFVPAKSASVSIVDRLFTRVGASDDLSAGQSTFMVEMSEVSDILKNATKNSLVILDEVGRGTSTFDGISIARAVAENICTNKKLGCKTLFATHYHELTALENQMQGAKNYSVAVKKHGDSIKFLRKIVPGSADDSYGIEVAMLAGIPKTVTDRAKKLLSELEMQAEYGKSANADNSSQISFASMNNDYIVDKLKKINTKELSDYECREFLEDLIDLLQ